MCVSAWGTGGLAGVREWSVLCASSGHLETTPSPAAGTVVSACERRRGGRAPGAQGGALRVPRRGTCATRGSPLGRAEHPGAVRGVRRGPGTLLRLNRGDGA